MTTLHVLANPYGITNPRYRMEPFNIAVGKFIKNMVLKGYNIIHYGHESSEVDSEHYTVITNRELPPPSDSDLFLENQILSKLFCQRVSDRLHKIKKPGDMVLCFYGIAHKDAVAEHQDLAIIEPSIGYLPQCVFAPFRGFTSYSQMHYFYGLNSMMLTPSWYDAVIPNAFTPTEFEYCADKEDYFVYLGRVQRDKGVDLCIQVTERLGKKLIIAGPGNLESLGYTATPKHVEMIGYVNAEQRKHLLKRAQCLMAPTHYLEPFGNITAEALFCGTPVITTDWGGFVDTVINGHNGYRAKDFKSFVEAASAIHRIQPQHCYASALSRFSDEVVHNQFDQWLQKINRKDFYHV